MDIRPYSAQDKAACLAVFDSNVPPFFDPAERAAFEEFLEAMPHPYFVMEHEGLVAGCGGYAIESDPTLASLTWGMVRRDLHGNGLGRFLLMFRLREIGGNPQVNRVRLSTAPAVVPFFEKLGFRVVAADGLVEMVKKLAVCV